MRSRIRRVRKPKGQLSFPRRDKNGQLRGGKRPGAGRKPKGERAGSPHKRRAELNQQHPQHVVLRAVKGIRSLRNGKSYRAIERALLHAMEFTTRLRIVHFSLQGNHVHLLCEADDKAALARGLQSFQICAAKHLNRAMGRKRGSVFPDRYYVTSMRTIAQTKHALSYVLNNWRKHQEDRRTQGLYEGRIDPYSSGVWYVDWRERTLPHVTFPPGYERRLVSSPQSWLLTIGYKRGRALSVYAIPSA